MLIDSFSLSNYLLHTQTFNRYFGKSQQQKEVNFIKMYDDNRRYSIRKTLRVTPAQWQMIQDRMDRVGVKDFNKYARQMLIEGYFFVIDDRKELKEFTIAINKIGNNINQIAHALNAGQQASQDDIDLIKDMMTTIWQYQRCIYTGQPF